MTDEQFETFMRELRTGFTNISYAVDQLHQKIAGYDLPSGTSIAGMMYKVYESESDRLMAWKEMTEAMRGMVREVTTHNTEQHRRLTDENRRLQALVEKLQAERQLWLGLRQQQV